MHLKCSNAAFSRENCVSVFAHNFKAVCSTTLKEIQVILSSAVNINTVLVYTYCFRERGQKT